MSNRKVLSIYIAFVFAIIFDNLVGFPLVSVFSGIYIAFNTILYEKKKNKRRTALFIMISYLAIQFILLFSLNIFQYSSTKLLAKQTIECATNYYSFEKEYPEQIKRENCNIDMKYRSGFFREFNIYYRKISDSECHIAFHAGLFCNYSLFLRNNSLEEREIGLLCW